MYWNWVFDWVIADDTSKDMFFLGGLPMYWNWVLDWGITDDASKNSLL